MKIVSKRGRKPEPAVEARELDMKRVGGGIIIVDGSGTMTQEEIDRATEAIQELMEQLNQLDEIINRGWFGQP
jgi:polyhydroxyalkanoate synthesis regulator phasin